jgi:hypothetical protein
LQFQIAVVQDGNEAAMFFSKENTALQKHYCISRLEGWPEPWSEAVAPWEELQDQSDICDCILN